MFLAAFKSLSEKSGFDFYEMALSFVTGFAHRLTGKWKVVGKGTMFFTFPFRTREALHSAWHRVPLSERGASATKRAKSKVERRRGVSRRSRRLTFRAATFCDE